MVRWVELASARPVLEERDVSNWGDRHDAIARIAARQLFFVGGAPRSGTTWLQQILDSHPAICCQGEGLFQRQLVKPLEALVAQWHQVLTDKNRALFGHTGGYPLPTQDDADFLARVAILQALARQAGERDFAAIGEKTPENVFLFPRLLHLFPGAKFIAIARDPRDVLTSAWHFFHRAAPNEDEAAAKLSFIRSALPSLVQGAHAMIDFVRDHPDETLIVTYEALRRTPEPLVARLFGFLGVADTPDLVAASLERTAFAAATGGRPAGVEEQRAFLRKGVVGDWRTTLTPEMNALMLRELGWSFGYFGFSPE
jgi:LPS sulfotransferase NodH